MLGEIMVRIGADIDELTNGLREGSRQLTAFGETASGLGGKIAGSFGAASAAITAGLGSAVSTAADFDTALRKAGAIAGASTEELAAMKDAALDLGASTSQSASGVAAAMSEMAAKGFTATEVIDSMGGVISAAEASGEDLALAADTVASSLNIFGLEAAESGRVADILAATANSTAAGIGDMSYALKYAGTPAAALGYTLEETSAAIGLMTNAGLDGSSAGTALAGSMYALVNAGDKQQKMMDSLGISVLDANGEMKSLSGIVTEFNTATDGMTDAQKTASVQTILGTEAAKGFLTLMSAGPTEIDKLTASLENSAGSSAATAEQMKAGIGGAIDGMKGAIETAAIMIGDQLVPYVQMAADFIGELANKFSGLSPSMQQAITLGAAIAAAVMGIVAIGGGLLMVIGSVISAIGAISGVVTTVVAAFSAGGVAATALGSAFAFLTGPIGIAIAAIVGLGAIFVAAYKNCEWFRDMVNAAWSAIKDTAVAAFGALKDAVSAAIGGIVSFGKEQLSFFTSIWTEHGSTISAIIKTALQLISVQFTATFGILKTVVSTGWSVIKAATQTTFAVFKTVISSAIQLATGIIKTGLSLMKGDFSGAWSTIKTTVSGIKNTIVNTFKGINLLQIGKDIISGLINGISNTAGKIKDKIMSIADNIPAWAKKALGIHSPSRVLRDQVGKFIPAGVVVGMDSGVRSVQAAAQRMATAAFPNFKTQATLQKTQLKAAQNAIASAVGANASEIKKVQQQLAADVAKIDKKAADKRAAAIAKEGSSKKKNAAALAKKLNDIESQRTQDVLKIQTKSKADIAKIEGTSNADKLKKLKEYAEAAKAAGNMTLADEVAYWKYSATAFKDGTKEKTAALEAYNKANESLLKEQFEAEKSYMDMRKSFNTISMKEEIVAYNHYRKQYKVGTAEYLHYAQKAHDTRKDLANKITAINEDFTKRSKQISDELISNEKAANDELENAVASRAEAIQGYFGIFDEVKEKERVEGSELTKNLSEQIYALANWQQQIGSLSQRGISADLMTELQGLGVDASAELEALNRMSEAELARYDELFQTKMAQARAAAENELAPLREETAAKVAAMREAATTELEALQTDWQAQLQQTINGTEQTFSSLKDIGAYAVQGLSDGMKSMQGELGKTAQTLADTIANTIRTALDVHSPSRLLRKIGVFTGEGLSLGLGDMEGDVERAAAKLAAAATPTVNPMQVSSFTNGETARIETQLQSQFKADEQRTQGDFVLQVDGYELARVQKSHMSGLMQREAALKTKLKGL